MNGQESWTQRKCPDCKLCPPLCQTQDRDCHSKWHSSSFDQLGTLWFAQKESKSGSVPSTSDRETRNATSQHIEDSTTQTTQPLVLESAPPSEVKSAAVQEESTLPSESMSVILQESTVSITGTIPQKGNMDDQKVPLIRKDDMVRTIPINLSIKVLSIQVYLLLFESDCQMKVLGFTNYIIDSNCTCTTYLFFASLSQLVVQK